jgi:hypothetical protein
LNVVGYNKTVNFKYRNQWYSAKFFQKPGQIMHKALNIVIIGASRGIGIQIARILTQQGHNLFCISRNKKASKNLRMSVPGFIPERGSIYLALM